MPSLTELRQLASHLAPSDKIVSSEVVDVISALVHFLDHGDEIVQALDRGEDEVKVILNPDHTPTVAPITAGDDAAAVSAQLKASELRQAELEQQIARLQAQFENRAEPAPAAPVEPAATLAPDVAEPVAEPAQTPSPVKTPAEVAAETGLADHAANPATVEPSTETVPEVPSSSGPFPAPADPGSPVVPGSGPVDPGAPA